MTVGQPQLYIYLALSKVLNFMRSHKNIFHFYNFLHKTHALLDFQVIMADKEAADRALKEPNPIIDGRKANVNLAILGAKPRGNLTGT